MNPDYTSDIRLVQRFIFEHSLYLLQMFDKKVASFCKPTYQSSSFVYNNFRCIYQPDKSKSDPCQDFVKDPTKPIWNCLMAVTCRVLYQQKNFQEESQIVSEINNLMKNFFDRYRMEHEEESNFKINLFCEELGLKYLNHNHLKTQNQMMLMGQKKIDYDEDVSELFKILNATLRKSSDEEYEMEDSQRIFQKNSYKVIMKMAAQDIFKNLKDKDYTQEQNIKFLRIQLVQYNKIVVKNISDLILGKAISMAICLLPKLNVIPLLVHPLLIPVFNIIKNQLQTHQSSSKMEENMEAQRNYCFPELSSQNNSKFVFINLDGYESQFNIDLAKYMSKYLMYVSFPRQNGEYSEKSAYEKQKSEHFLRKYFFGGLSPQQKQNLLSNFQASEKQLKKNLHVYPISSQFLNNLHNLRGVQQFQSAFISFMMKEVVYNHILDFNPSCIIISYSQKLTIQQQFFVEMLKQLTVLANYKIIFYANLSKNYLFDELIPEQLGNNLKVFMKEEEDNFVKHQRNIQVFMQNEKINTDIFDKLAIAMKISSGTFNLNKNIEQDSYLQKYKNGKVMKYAGPLLNLLSAEYSHLSKIKLRLADYSKISQALNTHFSRKDLYERVFENKLTKNEGFHACLIKQIKKIVAPTNSMIVQLPQELSEFRKKIEEKYPGVKKDQMLQNFTFEYCLGVISEKIQNRKMFHLPPYKKSSKTAKKSVENVISLQFQILDKKQRISVEFCSCSKFYFDSERKNPEALIYVTNHLVKYSYPRYMHFYGVITPQFDQKADPKVLLFPATFSGARQLSQFQTYTQFNYFQSSKYVFMFWPKIFDARKQLLSKICGIKYNPQMTNLFFRALKSSPGNFTTLQIQNPEEYNSIIPRFGCKCYEVPNTNTFYVMGGYYTDEHNYLKFQSDLTQVRYQQFQPNQQKQGSRIMVNNIPKMFYFELQEVEGKPSIVRQFKNSLILPKIDYQIIQMDEKVQGQKSIILIGGVGQKFIHPSSIIGYTANKLTFGIKTGDILSCKKIFTNRLIPVNVKGPVKLRAPYEMNIVSNPQNRNIYMTQGYTGMAGEVTTYHQINYEKHEDNFKFNYQTEYQFSQPDRRCYKDQILLPRRNPSENFNKFGLTAVSLKSKGSNTNIIKISDKSYRQLYFEVSSTFKNQYPNHPSIVRLTDSNIISNDISGSSLFALINHELYTQGKCVLGFFDLSELPENGKIAKEGKTSQIVLKQIYKFDQDVRHNIIIAANASSIVVIHGRVFDQNANISEMVIKKKSKGPFKVSRIRRNQREAKQNLTRIIIRGLQCSMFLNLNGEILCFSFQTIEKHSDAKQKVSFSIDKLNLAITTDSSYVWQTIFEKDLFLIVKETGNKKRNQPFQMVEIIQHGAQTQQDILKCTYQIRAFLDGECYSGAYRPFLQLQKIQFEPSQKNKSVEEYEKESITDMTSKQNSIFLDKSFSKYDNFKSFGNEMMEQIS